MAKSELDVNEPLNLPEPKIGLIDDTTEPNKSEAVVEPEPEDPKPEEPEPKEPDISATPGPDPFDLSKYRINPATVQANGVRKMRVTVPVRKPNAQEWFRVHPASHYRMDLPMITLKEDREEYLVNPAIWPALASEVTPVTLFTCVNRQGVVFLWPVKLPTPDGRRSEWIISSRTAAKTAMEKYGASADPRGGRAPNPARPLRRQGRYRPRGATSAP